MARPVLITRALAAVLAVWTLAPAPALADEPAQVGIDEIYHEVGVADTPTDYVVLVDTSRSMAEDGRYSGVRSGLRGFFAGLDAADRVTLITFAEVPTIVYTGPRPGPAVIARMPATPEGNATDIGAALDRALAVLEGGDTGAHGAVVLLTDGEHAPLAGSRFASSTAWPALAERGRALGERVSGYAIPLAGGENGAELLTGTVPGTVTLALANPSEVVDLLDRLDERVRRTELGRLVAGDVNGTVAATWSAFPDGGDLASSVRVTLTLRTTTSVLPLWVSGLRGELVGVGGTVTGLPEEILLPPGEAQHIDVVVRSTEAAGLRLGERTTEVPTRLRLAGVVSSPWTTAIESELDIDFALRDLDSTAAWPSVWTTGLSWTWIVFIGVLLLGVLITGLVTWELRNPQLRGHLLAQSADGGAQRIALEGSRRVRFARPASLSDPSVSGEFVVRGTRDGGALVTYFPARGQPGQPRKLPPDVDVDVYGILIRHLRP
ncbi:vWA domain-containing protein [Actinokineospora fastidiosa]|uniref:VWFA domain-containing protein n=1 Tax=Actinokineospora fastidiosa TaxID=1816 RepID=A0A918GQZ5_9PSEU|nr:vWA domain-containing protein [Actinokineospora fastidiosa]GGS54763.1 hypothetical protein GCM10010171_57390 [Actinokineospora fastidiosa]